ncbi:MAG: hypothetical protein AAF288_01080 [Planctomycetota bacterium]
MTASDINPAEVLAQARLRPWHWTAFVLLIAANGAAGVWALRSALPDPLEAASNSAYTSGSSLATNDASLDALYARPGARDVVETLMSPGQADSRLRRRAWWPASTEAEAEAVQADVARMAVALGLQQQTPPSRSSTTAVDGTLFFGDPPPGLRVAVVGVENAGDDWRVRLATLEPAPAGRLP